jgi:hypothetical protein
VNHQRPLASSFCSHRSVADDGRLLCDCVADADREVTADLCHGCPAAAADCPSLRFSLHKEAGAGIIVRYGNGRSVILDQAPTALKLCHAACRVTAWAVSSPDECRACSLRRAGATFADTRLGLVPLSAANASQRAASNAWVPDRYPALLGQWAIGRDAAPHYVGEGSG